MLAIAMKTRRMIGIVVAAATLATAPAALAGQNHTRPQPVAGKTDNPARISKFEARKARHVCRDRANEKGLKGSDRDAFVGRCYFGRLSHAGVRRECVRAGEAKGIAKAALRDFVRDCVKERTKGKE